MYSTANSVQPNSCTCNHLIVSLASADSIAAIKLGSLLLEVLFIYSIKNGKTDLFSLFAYIPSFQLVTHLLDSMKGEGKGHVLVKGVWAGLSEHPERAFSPNSSLALPGRVAFRACPAFACCYFSLVL